MLEAIEDRLTELITLLVEELVSLLSHNDGGNFVNVTTGSAHEAI